MSLDIVAVSATAGASDLVMAVLVETVSATAGASDPEMSLDIVAVSATVGASDSVRIWGSVSEPIGSSITAKFALPATSSQANIVASISLGNAV